MPSVTAMPSDIVVRLPDSGAVVEINWQNGGSARFHAVWLRDHGQDAQSRNPANGQKLLTATDIPADLRVVAATIEESRLHLTFSDHADTWLDLERLREISSQHSRGADLVDPTLSIWDSASVQSDQVVTSFSDIQQNPTALLQWLEWIERYGFARLVDVPNREGALFDVIALFGFVRETNYGRLFEVRSEPDPVNLAYTRVGLDPHTDNPYRDPTPTIQVLHCLENTAEGGESSVVDGFRVAEVLRQEDPAGFDLLSRTNVTFRYHGDETSDLVAHRPMIELSPEGQLIQVRINNRAFQELTDIPFERIPDFYSAYRHLVEITRRDSMTVTFRQAPGELFVVDNTRVLHGRQGFTAAGTRWLQGAYADMDGLRSTINVLRQRIAA